MVVRFKKAFSVLYIAALALGFAAGCGEKDEDAEEKKELEGTWAWPCVADNSGSNNLQGDNDHMIQSMIFEGDNFEYRTTMFNDSACTDQFAHFGYVGTYVTEGESETVTDAKNWSFTVTSITATIASSDVVNMFNSSSECGFTDWAVGVAKTISGQTCDTLADIASETVPFTHVDIYKRDGSSLYMGAESGSDGVRPTELNTQAATKQ
jgi:hypothetical protein